MTDNDFANRYNDPVRVFFDSKNAYRSGTGSYNFTLDLDAYLDTYDIYFQLRKLQCTYSWYNISEINNTVSFNDGTTVITIDPGNYNLPDLLELLNRNTGGYQFSYNNNTGLVTIKNASTFHWDATSSMYTVLGFSTFPTGEDTIFISTELPDVSPIKVVNFHLTSVPSRSFALYPSTQYTRLIGSLFVENNIPYTCIESTDETIYRESTLQNRVRQMQIELYDQRGYPIDLKNGSFQMIFEFSFRPKKVMRLSDFL